MQHVIIGNSAAGIAAAGEIRQRDPGAEIVMIGRDHFCYSRCQLHWVAAGTKSPESTAFISSDWLGRNRIDARFGQAVTGIHPPGRTIQLADGSRIKYDRLLIATGARALLPPIPGLAGPQTFVLRDMADAMALRAQLPEARHIVVIGAGLVGVELAEALAKGGKGVSLVELAGHPLPAQLEHRTGRLCQQLLEHHKIKVYCADAVIGIERQAESGLPQLVKLRSGAELPADLIVAAAGVKANTELAEAAGISCGRGIRIDPDGRTSQPDIYAAGDVTEAWDTLVDSIMPTAIWPAAVRQGKVAGANMAGGTETLVYNTGLRAAVKVTDVNVISLGQLSRPQPHWQEHLYRGTDSHGQAWLKIFYVDGQRLRGALLWGDVTNAGIYGEAIITGRDITADLDHLSRLDSASRGLEDVAIP